MPRTATPPTTPPAIAPASDDLWVAPELAFAPPRNVVADEPLDDDGEPDEGVGALDVGADAEVRVAVAADVDITVEVDVTVDIKVEVLVGMGVDSGACSSASAADTSKLLFSVTDR